MSCWSFRKCILARKHYSIIMWCEIKDKWNDANGINLHLILICISGCGILPCNALNIDLKFRRSRECFNLIGKGESCEMRMGVQRRRYFHAKRVSHKWCHQQILMPAYTLLSLVDWLFCRFNTAKMWIYFMSSLKFNFAKSANCLQN